MSRSQLARIVAALVLTVASTAARADDYDDNGDYSDHVLHRIEQRTGRTFAELGFASGQRGIGDQIANQSELMFGFGIQRGHYALIGELHLGGMRGDEDPKLAAFTGEAGIYLRRDAVAWPFGDHSFAAQIATWVDAGLSGEMLWFGTDTIYRPQASLGIGVGLEAFGHDRSLGFTVDIRVLAAPSVEWDPVSDRCAGGCAMHYARPDWSMVAVLGFPFSL